MSEKIKKLKNLSFNDNGDDYDYETSRAVSIELLSGVGSVGKGSGDL